eukprot:Filipodium_phascolosomae@DN7467_c0_g1_i1.p1
MICCRRRQDPTKVELSTNEGSHANAAVGNAVATATQQLGNRAGTQAQQGENTVATSTHTLLVPHWATGQRTHTLFPFKLPTRTAGVSSAPSPALYRSLHE